MRIATRNVRGAGVDCGTGRAGVVTAAAAVRYKASMNAAEAAAVNQRDRLSIRKGKPSVVKAGLPFT